DTEVLAPKALLPSRLAVGRKDRMLRLLSRPPVLTAALIALAIVTEAAAQETQARTNFRTEVVPALTRAGCNAGTCHGSPSGKNGFALSLRGYDPALDYRALTHQAEGRRLDRLQAEASLVLLKATARVPHEGGQRFEVGSTLYMVLRDWIAAGAQ